MAQEVITEREQLVTVYWLIETADLLVTLEEKVRVPKVISINP